MFIVLFSINIKLSPLRFFSKLTDLYCSNDLERSLRNIVVNVFHYLNIKNSLKTIDDSGKICIKIQHKELDLIF